MLVGSNRAYGHRGWLVSINEGGRVDFQTNWRRRRSQREAAEGGHRRGGGRRRSQGKNLEP